jgi:hypothetical protein
LDLTQRGLDSAESWMRTASSIYQPGMLNVGSMFVSPQQQAGFDVNERNSAFQQQWMKAQIEGMPDPTVVGEWNLGMSTGNSILSAVSAPGGAKGAGQAAAASGL